MVKLMDYLSKLIENIELHSVDGIRHCFQNGVDPNMEFRGEPLFYELTGEYTRSPHFSECVRTFINAGLRFHDEVLLAVLANDADALGKLLDSNPDAVSNFYTLRCAYTPFYKVSLLHICAEFNQVPCAEVLVDHGMKVNIQAGVDSYGFGGQTPIFHTVNQNGHQSAEMLNFLLDRGADLHITIAGLIWGKGYEWETLIPAVNPISYAMMGLLPQMHRDEEVIARVVSMLLKRTGIDYTPPNVPNAYVNK